MDVVLIGCGGIGGWAAQCLDKTLKKDDKLLLVDGDTIEEKNIDRQLFNNRDIGECKSLALNEKLTGDHDAMSFHTYLGSQEWFQVVRKMIPDYATIIVGVDNHPARAMALDLCDEIMGDCIIAANEYEDAEAMYYKAPWKDGDLDPRTYYPEILTDKEDNPLTPPCTGEVLESAPQLAVANMNAASIAMWLFWYWKNNASKLTMPEAVAKRVVGVRNNAFGWQFITEESRKQKETA